MSDDWRAMTRDRFDREAQSVQLALLPAPDRCGTGDLLDALEVPYPVTTPEETR